jgi:DNA-binding XRE family transcriptional regulator
MKISSGDTVMAFRKRLKLSIEELSLKRGVSHSAIVLIEDNKLS